MYEALLNKYCSESGLEDNRRKSSLSFSNNTYSRMKSNISKLLGIKCNSKPNRYLGVGIIFQKRRSAKFAILKERLSSKALGWKGRLLNQEGGGILIKSVLQVIPAHQMSCFKISKKVLNVLNSITSKFWWGKMNDKDRIHWQSWDKLCDGKF